MYNGHNFVCANGQGLPSLVTLHEAADAAAASGATPPSFNMTKRGAWLSELIRGGNATPGWLRERFVARGNKTLIAERRKQVVRLKDDGASLGWPEGPDVILLGSGHHDLRDPDFSLDSYAARLRAVWRLIRDAIPSSRRSPPHLIWMTPATVYARPEVLTSKKVVTCPSTNKSSPQVHYSHPHILYKLMGELSNAIAQEMGADVLDMDQIRELRPYDGDGMHCITGLVCKSDLDVLLRMLEIGPRTKHASAG